MSRHEGQLCGFGRLFQPGVETCSENLEEASLTAPLFRGLGRSYGDASLPAPSQGRVLSTRYADRILQFDKKRGLLRAEAGLSLSTLNQVVLPQNWFVPVTPGTQFVTLGGMVAADVHGKNHHVAGGFGQHVRELKMRVADGRVLTVSPTQEADLFRATLGGMGLFGHILEVEFQLEALPSPWIEMESERVDNIDAYLQALKDAASQWPFTVGWIDCLTQGPHMGRGILTKGRWAKASMAWQATPKAKRALPFPLEAPDFFLSPFTIQAFNFAYYWKHLPRKQQGIVSPYPFFYPLDAIANWNLMYGKHGFTQYQCVLPDRAGPHVARRFLECLTQQGGASFLCVIKDCGPQGTGVLSFPEKGISIALDIPVRSGTQALIDQLNAFVMENGGRIYLAKDAFTRPEDFRRMEQKRLPLFESLRNVWDPERKFRSALSVRLLGDSP